MSDTFSADDETASGGLQSDMPSIGAASPPPRAAPPSPLGGLAQVVQSLFGGRPAPQPAMLGRSPFQVPGRSQIPQGPPGAQPGGPRWSGTTASLALPQGTPQPRANFTPYQRSLPIRSPDQWGQAEQFGRLPSSFEVAPMWQGLSQFFGQNGSQLSIPLALAMGKNSGAFLQGLMKGQEQAAKEARERAKDAAIKLQAQQEMEHHAYADIVAEYGAKDRTMNTAINGVPVRDALYNQAIQLGDDKMTALIESGANVSDIIWFQQQRDANLQDLQKTNKKADEQDFADKLYGTGGEDGGDKGSFAQQVARGSQAAGPRQAAPETPSGAAPETPGATPETKAAPVDASGRPVERSSDDNSTLLDEAAVGMLMNQKPDKEQLGAKQQMIAYKRMLQMQRSIDEMLKDPSLRGNEQAIHDRLAKEVSPAVAQQFEGALNYDVNLGQTWGGRTDPLKNDIQNLAEWARPGDANGTGAWSASNYAAQTRFREDSQTQQTQLRVETMDSSGQQLIEALHNAPTAISDPSAWRRFAATAPGNWSGEPWAVGIQNAWLNYNMEKNTLIRAGGGSVTQEEESRAIVPSALGSPSAYLTAVQQDAGNAVDRVMATQNRWRGIGGRGMFPGFNEDAFRGVMKLANTDPLHELEPGGTIKTDHGTMRWNGVYDEDGNKIPASKRWTLQP